MTSTGLVFDIRRYSIHDGPGIRTTVFFKGCPLSCKWCHNPEGISKQKELMFYQNRCIICGDCIKVCPSHALNQGEKGISIDRTKCNVSEKCAIVCPSEALQIVGKELGVNEIITIIEKDLDFYTQSGGGVTFSGGEPLAQPQFLYDVLLACKEKNISAALDTCGFSPQSVIEKTIPFVDLFLFDIKIMDDEKHIQWTGVSNKQILSNIQYLSTQGARVLARVPIIPGVNDDDANITATAKFLNGLPIVPSIELLAYHNLAEGKFKSLGKSSEYKDKGKVSKEIIDHFSCVFSKAGIQVLGIESI